MDDWSLLPSRDAVGDPAPDRQRTLSLDTRGPFMDDIGATGFGHLPATGYRFVETRILL